MDKQIKEELTKIYADRGSSKKTVFRCFVR